MVGGIIQGLIILNQEETYAPQPWHGTLLIMAIAAFAVFFNTVAAKKLPLVEALLLILHVVGLFVIIIPLWVLAPRTSAKVVFTEFNNGGGWSSMGTSVMVGLSTSLPSMLGFDCAVHMCMYLPILFKLSRGAANDRYRSRRNQGRVKDTAKGHYKCRLRERRAGIRHACHAVLHHGKCAGSPRLADGLPIYPGLLQHDYEFPRRVGHGCTCRRFAHCQRDQ